MDNAKQLKIGVLRLSGHPIDLPPGYELVKQSNGVISVIGELVAGGREYDNRSLGELDANAVSYAVRELIRRGAQAIGIVGIFSPLHNADELRVKDIILSDSLDCPIILSHQMGGLGFIERENATILAAAKWLSRF